MPESTDDDIHELPDTLPEFHDDEQDPAAKMRDAQLTAPDTALGKLERDIRRVIQRYLKRRS